MVRGSAWEVFHLWQLALPFLGRTSSTSPALHKPVQPASPDLFAKRARLGKPGRCSCFVKGSWWRGGGAEQSWCQSCDGPVLSVCSLCHWQRTRLGGTLTSDAGQW